MIFVRPVRTGQLRTIAASDAAFALLLSLLSTVLAYRFGAGNQIEQLPIILRQLDPAYLPNDFFVSSSEAFGPRFYFARIVALTCQLTPLPWAYATLRFASDLTLIIVTMWAAGRVVGADRTGAMIAAVLTVAVSSFHLGDATELRYYVFQPASLAIPGMLFAISLGVLGRPMVAGLVASLTSVPHPLYGAYGGAIGLATGFLAVAAARWRHGAGPALRAAALRSGLGGAVFGAGLLALWWWPSQSVQAAPLSTAELFDILARFRSPHHYLPSHFRPSDYLTTALFAWATWVAFDRWRTRAPPDRTRLILVPIVFVVAGCVAGTLFTEVWPLRSVLMLQPFRLLAVLKWIGFLLLAWLLADYWQRPSGVVSRPVAAMSLLSAGGAHPIVTAAGVTIVRFQSWLPAAAPPGVWIALLAAGTVALSFAFGSLSERVRLFAGVVLLAAFVQPRAGTRAVAGVVTLLAALGIATNRPGGSVFRDTPLRPVFSLEDRRDVEAETARAAARHTPEDAIFVAPPEFGVLRIIGRRALVVDFEAIPLQGDHMRAWRERIRDVYGEVAASGHEARAALQQQYRSVTDAHLQALAHGYGATHAVLYAGTATSLPVLHANEVYRVVRIEP